MTEEAVTERKDSPASRTSVPIDPGAIVAIRLRQLSSRASYHPTPAHRLPNTGGLVFTADQPKK
jgi:hypothetical protein